MPFDSYSIFPNNVLAAILQDSFLILIAYRREVENSHWLASLIDKLRLFDTPLGQFICLIRIGTKSLAKFHPHPPLACEKRRHRKHLLYWLWTTPRWRRQINLRFSLSFFSGNDYYTPLDALEPYTAVALASFSTSILSISLGLIKFRGLLGTPVEELSNKNPSTT